MDQKIRGVMAKPILASDIDGTLLPLEDNEHHKRDLLSINELVDAEKVDLILVTGRDIGSTRQVVRESGLPWPRFMIVAMGTEIYWCHKERDSVPEEIVEYGNHLRALAPDFSTSDLAYLLRDIEGLELRPAPKQGPFKLSYFARPTPSNEMALAEAGGPRDVERSLNEMLAERVGQVTERLRQSGVSNARVVSSVNPVWQSAMIDVLPSMVSKAYAIDWWVENQNLSRESIIFCGDSGNDLDAFTAGYKTVVVANAERSVARKAFEFHESQTWRNRFRLSPKSATSGVLEGLRWFGAVSDPDRTEPEMLGATVMSHDTCFFRVWAPRKKNISVCREGAETDGAPVSLVKRDDGYYAAEVSGFRAGDKYRYIINGEHRRADPVSSFQPDGVHEASQIVDHDRFPWQDQANGYVGVTRRDLVIYEMHFGTFTREGTYLAAIDRIADLVSLGVTAIEVLPLAQCSGSRNWGYDGVYLFAPSNNYGTPDDFRRFVDECHAVGIAVIVDVVYNHLGPEGNYLKEFAPYFSRKHGTPWGDALDFDGKHHAAACRFVIENVRYWLQKFHVDGLRLDAVHFMFDDRPANEAILQQVRREVDRVAEDCNWPIHLIGEANIYDHCLLYPEGERGYDAIWADDIMHSIYGVMRPELNLAHRDYRGPQDLAEALEYGYLYTGPKLSRVDAKERQRLHGGDRDEEGCESIDRKYLERLVVGLQTHDCVGNHPQGLRFHQLTDYETQQTASALTMFYPSIPIIFMGEEQATDSPFMFFVDFGNPSLQRAVDRGRKSEYSQHQWKGALNPSDYMAFRRSKCINSPNEGMLMWYRQLISLRRQLSSVGLISAENLRIECDHMVNRYGYRYEDSETGWIQVQANLGRMETLSEFNVPLAGEVLLASDNVVRATAGEEKAISLPANSVVITGELA